jgi:hypothetical protein
MFMREVSFFWKRANAGHLVSGPLTNIFQSIHFISYARRVPKDIRCIFKAHFQPNKGPEDIAEISFLDLVEVLMEPENEGDGTVMVVKINHPASNLSARSKGTSAVPGACFLDGEGITYTLQGPPISLRLLSGFLRMIAKPDRTSARTVRYNLKDDNGVLSRKQLRLAKFAYDRGYFDTPKRIRIAELAQELGLARATISEHMARIESAIMDDMFSSFSDVYVAPETLSELLKISVDDEEEIEGFQTDGFRHLMKQIKGSIYEELSTIELTETDGEDLQSYIEESMRQHKENLSFIDEQLTNKNSGVNQH